MLNKKNGYSFFAYSHAIFAYSHVLSNSGGQHLSHLCSLLLFYIRPWELQDRSLSIYEAATMHAQLFLMFNYYLRSHRHHFENNGTLFIPIFYGILAPRNAM